ncbi:serine hydrolase domain-containing protein [Paenibacillus faecalis]|uniref:serine hydrolase domain-containing protein n=1 Tax=Paenibacillus faecalis TaxID=2079532 RepID=UPI000D0F964E|nr:serine hydrolase domain-containing protein [Paenibacillus faecalis]
MKKRLSWILTVALVLVLLVPTTVMASAGGKEAGTSQDLSKIAAEKAALLTEKYGTTSVQYALIDNGTITVSGQAGLNDMEGKKPLTKDTMYGIGSTSKVFTAAAVMKLVQEGKINLDSPLVQYIPDFTMKDERYKQITPRMLLNHSSGLHGSSFRNAFLFEDNDTFAHDTLLKQLSVQTLKADPGAFSVYSNDGFTLAEILVERVSGRDFTAFLHQHFMKPLGMKHTKTSQDELESDQMAALYYPVYQGQLPIETTNVIGTGGVYSTAEDLVRFSQIFTGQVDDILSAQSVRAMEQAEYKKGLWPEEADNSFDYGLGWDSVRLFPFNDYGIKALTKGGDTTMYHASLIVLPEQNMAAAVLSSGGSSSLNQMLATEMLLQALKEKEIIQEIKPAKSFGQPVKADMPKDVMKHAGYYGSLNSQFEIAIRENGELTLSTPLAPDTPGQEYVYTSDGSFVNQEGSSKLRFVTEKNGRTYLWSNDYLTIPDLGQQALSHYMAEKLEEHTISEESAKAWEKREGKTYYPLNEKYTSVMYFIMKPTLQISRTEALPGYLLDKKITGPDTTASHIQIPGMMGRDTFEHRFYTKGGVEYFEAAGALYVSEEQIKSLYKGKQSTVTLNKEGHAKWYTVPNKAVGKTMTVDMPENGAFAVYDGQGLCTNFTVVSGNNKVKLPEDGVIVFAGDPGSSFEITLK